jgi:hypothetical protein
MILKYGITYVRRPDELGLARIEAGDSRGGERQCGDERTALHAL